MNAIFELWSAIMPERAIACSFNLEYLLVGGRDARGDDRPFFMWYDWMAGGWGGRSTKDGSTATAPVFGVGLAVQPCEGQERLTPVLTTKHAIIPDSGGPGLHRGGCGVTKGGTLTDCENTVMSYCCDRSRSVTWGINGGLPSIPHGVWLNRGTVEEAFLGSVFSSVAVQAGDTFERPSAGGGGLGDPLGRAPEDVLEDVIDGYVTVPGGARDYGVVITPIDPEIDQYEIDRAATEALRAEIRAARKQWLNVDPEEVAGRFRDGELDTFDLLRRYGVIVDWGTGELLPNTTKQFRDLLHVRAAAHWD
jgi:N-methylhydantoinase B